MDGYTQLAASQKGEPAKKKPKVEVKTPAEWDPLRRGKKVKTPGATPSVRPVPKLGAAGDVKPDISNLPKSSASSSAQTDSPASREELGRLYTMVRQQYGISAETKMGLLLSASE